MMNEEDYIKNKDWKGLAKFSAEQLKNKRFDEAKKVKEKDIEYRDYVVNSHGNNKHRTHVIKK